MTEPNEDKVYELVKSGEWTIEQFKKWVSDLTDQYYNEDF